ncbi:MAG TPA: phosphate ABC transporter substrate-binding protein PstS [Gaiellaceae bacterium]|nr:phosphate ABC transporter substrate-binding protein PstS [Gaiellaceae bacterium]
MPKHGMLIRSILVLAAAALLASIAVGSAAAGHKSRQGGTLRGAGSSLVAPAFSIWAPAYQSAKGVTVNYSSVGSGAGIAQISARTVDFGASDAPFSTAQAQGCVVNGVGCINIPWALAATGPVVNIPGVGTLQLKLTGPVLAKIYLGQITNWSDPAITKLNPGLNLPNMAIHVVYRSDGSGDTYAFTNYLSKVSKQWASQVGYATTVNWPTGTGGHGNNGVAAVIGATSGSIGYVSTAYTIANHLRIARLKNASGRYAAPTVRAIESAASLVNSRKIPKNFVGGLSIVNPPKTKTHKYTNAWPISTFTYVLVPLKTPQAALIKSLIKWVLQPAQQKSIQHLVFAPMPTVVVKAAEKALNKISS